MVSDQISLFAAAERERLDQAAREHVAAGRRTNTATAYTADRRTWNRYCAAFGISEHALSLGTLVGFVEWLIEQQAAPKTIERRLVGARRSLSAEGVEDLAEQDRALVAERLRQYRYALAESGEHRGRGKAPAITIGELRRLSRVLPSTLLGLRDRALILVGFGLAARRSELAGLWARDVVVSADGLVITLRSSKTSDGPVEVAVPAGTSALTCPVRAWQTYRAALEDALAASLTGRAFRHIDRHERIYPSLTGQTVSRVLKRTAVEAGLDPTRVSAHSLRAGMATEARRAGHDVRTIAQQGRWSPTSAALYGYLQIVDRWDDNALKGIGL